MPKTLFICLAAYCAPNVDGHDPLALHRQESYVVPLHNLINQSGSDTELIVVDNTCTAISELKNNLKKELADSKIKDVMLIKSNDLGKKNKGAGEYEMCLAVVAKHREYIKDFSWVVYYTSRHVISSFPLIKEYLEKYQNKEAILSSAQYIYADGSKSPADEKQFDDVIFAMKPETFLKYVDSMDPSAMVADRIGSESNLFNYIQKNKIDYQLVNRWGLLRYNYAIHKSEII